MDSHPRFRWLEDLYWCGIPQACRHCDWLPGCRSSFWTGRRCRSGCIKKKRKNDYLRDRDRSDYVDQLVKFAEDREARKK